MCGIVGYIGSKKVVPVIIEGLRKLEYRGYDSAGIAVVAKDGKLEIRRAPGKLRNLEEVLQNRRSKAPTASATRGGRRTGGRRKKTRIPTAIAAARSWSCTTASSRTTSNSKNSCSAKATHSSPRPTQKSSRTSSRKHSTGGARLEEAVRKSLKQLRGIYSLWSFVRERTA